MFNIKNDILMGVDKRMTMTYQEFIEKLSEAGSNMSTDEINKLGEEAHNQFGVDGDALKFILLSGKDEFKKWVFDQASIRLQSK